jgi:predicted nucleotidyltransferase
LALITREMIEQFGDPISEEVVDFAVSWLEPTLKQIIEDLRKKYSVISSDYEILLEGDFTTLTTTVNSDIDVFVALKSPQLELNSMQLVNNKFKQFFKKVKLAWKQTREEKYSKRKRKKMQEKQMQEVEIPLNKYSVADFKYSLVRKIIGEIDNQSYIYILPTGFKIVAREHFGVDINVYPALRTPKGFKLYNEYTAKFVDVEYEDLIQNIEEKLNAVGQIYLEMVRVFKNLYFNVYNSKPSKFFVESLIFSVPDELFDGYDFYEIFVKLLNYLANAHSDSFVLVTNKQNKLFRSAKISENVVTLNNMIKQIEKWL